jgi:hypothetical protein
MKRKAAHIICALAVVIAQNLSALGQADVSTGTLKGTITDQNGAVVVGATVTAKNAERGLSRIVQTDSGGIYQITLLQPGAYQLRIESTGFETRVANNVEITVGQIVVLDVQLKVGNVTSEVVVTTDAPVIEVERTQQANTINQAQIENLPNIGRGFMAPVYSLPGVSSADVPRTQNPGFTFGTSGISIGGSNGRNNLVTLDGGENEYGSGQLRTNISPEAVQEFQVNRNAFAAEYGFTAGTAINVITKSGTNNFHGSAYVFYRSQKTSAANFFNVGPEKAFDQQIFPGGTFGGPIVKNKAFFFTSYEHLKSDTARFRQYTNNVLLTGPTPNQLLVLNPLLTSANANTRRIATDLRNTLTTTNFPQTMELLRRSEGNINAPDRLHNWTTRVDYQISSTDNLNGRFSLTHNETDNLLGGNSTTAPSASASLPVRDYTAVVNWNHSFGTNLVNQMRGQIVPNNSARTIPKAPGTTSLLIQGIGGFGQDFATPFNTFQDRYQFDDTLVWSHGRHNVKLGGSFRSVNYRVVNALWFSGEWQFFSGTYPLVLAVPAADRGAFLGAVGGSTPAASNLSSIQSFNLNLPTVYRQGFGNPEWHDWAHYLGLFAQDSWKVTPRLTVDFGVRFDYDAEPSPLQSNGYFAPRFGFAWDPWGDQKTVIRGGAGMFYSPVYYQVAYVTNLLNDTGLFINQVFRTGLNAAAIFQGGVALGKLPFEALTEDDAEALGVPTGPKTPGRVIFGADPDYKNNYAIQASLGISRELIRNLSLDVAYQMYRGVHIQMDHEVNFRESGQLASFGGLDPAGLGPLYTPIDPTIAQNNVYKSIGNSIYHGMTVSLTKRWTDNFQFQANYTFSKAIDDQTDFNSAFSAFLPTRLDLERAVSAFDVPHNFVFNAVFRTPFKPGSDSNLFERAFADMTISPVVAMRSGIPFTIRIGVADVNRDNHTTYDRPFFAPRNSGRGANYYSFDMRVMKQFFIDRDSGLRIDFIAESTNVFNKTNFLSVNDVFGTNLTLLNEILFGPFDLRGSKNIPRQQPLGFNSAFPGRRIQFGLKFAF